MKIIKIIIAVIIILISVAIIYMIVINNTIPRNLGIHDGMLYKMPASPNAVSSQTSDINKFVEPFAYLGDFKNSKDVIIQIINEFKGAKIITNNEKYIHAVFTTSTMKFKDDVEFYFDDSNNIIHFRSASRIGYSDNGLNRNRYDELSKIYYGK